MISIVVIYRPEDEPYLDELILSIPRKDVEVVLARTLKADVEEYTSKIIQDKGIYRMVDIYYPENEMFHFGKARNEANKYAQEKYIMSLDADERLIESQHPMIFQYVNIMDKNPNMWGLKAFNLSTIPDFLGDNVSQFRVADGEQVKIYRNIPEIYFIGGIHETVSTSITNNMKSVLSTPVIVLHIGYNTDIDTMIRKAERNVDGLITQGNLTIEKEYFKRLLKRDILNLYELKDVKKNKGL